MYSLHAHHHKHSCGFIGDEDLGRMYLFSPKYILSVDTSVDCHLHYLLLSRSTTLSKVHYIQPKGAFKPSFAKQAVNADHNDWRTVQYMEHHPKGDLANAQ